ncbi:hypothetical protein CO173_04220 [Candidatus Uhrbacteria bacterium CG_4_9_14_3_um_filter_41_35]|uniref:NYN domain-containing protein n=1 Tax=Candidatus Uhrbacteria bacterium CG_4_9_14_3_um_filter_41_35 TaxID=1975034 RepID=A0A2M7XDD1_9BACT|nr:MAG: hypothetical protein COV92_03600 [Candidatus Uhrbacteria bacterium CG11_big_fil_rev_8_21_14_0_20_41_9]PJA45889.1 MAG: hypothetical protein CO173_04220 [Candidatus Uhrbacteria bacterium CG_4_9_14_3_um_filter_41_35]
MLSTNTRRVGVFIDVQNMYYSARNLYNQKVNFENIVKETVGDASLVRAIAYTISTKGGDEEPFFEALRKSGIEVVSKELLEYSGGNKKGDWDVGVTIDIIRMLDMLDVVVLVSGDGDFVPLTDFVRSRGRIVHIASFRESTSSSLVESADIYTNFSDEKRKFLIPNKKSKSTGKQNTAYNAPEEIEENSSAAIDYFKTAKVKSDDQNDTSRTRRLSF